jgi:hypothetical protein
MRIAWWSAIGGCMAFGCVAAPLPPSQVPAPRPASASAPASTPDMAAASPTRLTLDTAIQAALADASQRSGLDASALRVISAEAVTWRDGSLGCPQPGMMYTQALVPGFRVRVLAAGQTLDYHASRFGAPLVCPAGRAVDPLPADPRT